MTIDKVSSERLSMLRFPLIVGVVFIHAYGTEVGLANSTIGVVNTGYWIDFVRDFISQGIARIAVPLFFLMAGYFFFLNFSFSVKNYSIKVKSRLKTLVVPFLFWNILTLALLALAQSAPVTQSFFSGKNASISTFGIFEYFNAIFGLNRSPISYQFWFIRDLIVMVVIAPAIYFFLKKSPHLLFFTISAVWILNIWPTYIPFSIAFIFFSAGAYFAHLNISLFELDRFFFLFAILFLLTTIIGSIKNGTYIHTYIHTYINNIRIIFGIVAMISFTKYLYHIVHVKKALLYAGGCSFFVFAVHEPLLTVLKKVAYKTINPNSDASVLLLYFLIPILVIVLSIILHVGMKTFTPKLLGLISGGR